MSPNSNHHSDIKSPQARGPSATASAMSPIASVKRPKKRTPMTNNSKTSMSTATTPVKTTLSRASEPLSPMHNIKRVPSDSHRIDTTTDDSAKSDDDSTGRAAYHPHESEKQPSIENTEPYPTIADVHDDDDDESHNSTSWVGRKVDAIFSPVLTFLQNATTNGVATCDDSSDEGNIVFKAPLPKNLGEELERMARMEDADGDNGEAVSTMTERDFRKDENRSVCSNGSQKFDSDKDLPESYDGIPTMTITESVSHPLDVDGDATMADYYKLDSQDAGAANEHNHDMSSTPVQTCEYDENIQVTSSVSNHNVSDESYDYDDDEEEFNPYLFIKCLPPYHHAIPPGWTSRPKALPPLDYDVVPSIPPICLVLDLDETLVHCTVEPVSDADMVFPVEFNGTDYQVHVRCRPFLQEFLEAVSRKFEVVIFTASQQVYADKLLDKIDPTGKFIRHRIFRDSCLPVEGNFLKDLTILGRDLSQAVLVDNSPHAFGYQVDNGIPIESWFDDPNDKELLKLEMFLRTLHGVDDVRDVVRKTFQIRQLVSSS